MSDLESKAPIGYIDKDRNCYLIAENGTEFLNNAFSWYENRKDYEEITVYVSKEAAMNENEFINIEELSVEE